MGLEIERKFLVVGDDWRAGREGLACRQGYLSAAIERTVRVRVMGEQAFLTVKGATQGLSRLEFEYSIPLAEAHAMLDALCLHPLVEKTRYERDYGGMVWEVDEFAGENRGLIVAEVELHAPDQEVDLPPWAGREVSEDPRYLNANLARHPYSEWKEAA
jgi:adenylate cyclase